MSDYPMLISNKLHSFRNFTPQNYIKSSERTNKKEVNAAEWLINERFVLLCL